MYIFIWAEFTPKLFLPEKNQGRVYNRPGIYIYIYNIHIMYNGRKADGRSF
jgi:hypothetical protein